MDGTPSRPPGYALPGYDDENDHFMSGSGGNPAAVRLLTSMEEPLEGPRPYVLPQIPSAALSSPGLVPAPLVIKKEAKQEKKTVKISTPEHLETLKKQEEAQQPSVSPDEG